MRRVCGLGLIVLAFALPFAFIPHLPTPALMAIAGFGGLAFWPLFVLLIQGIRMCEGDE